MTYPGKIKKHLSSVQSLPLKVAVSATLCVASLLLTTRHVQAQEAAGDASAQRESLPETVTVQARRRDEDLQSVPVAVTALAEADLKAQDLGNVFRMARTIPSFNFCCKQGSVSPFV